MARVEPLNDEGSPPGGSRWRKRWSKKGAYNMFFIMNLTESWSEMSRTFCMVKSDLPFCWTMSSCGPQKRAQLKGKGSGYGLRNLFT